MNNYLALTLPAAVVIAAPAVATVMSPKEYVMTAGASDLFERQSAQLMMDSGDPRIRSFAMMMLKMHSDSTAMVKAAAVAAKIPVLPPMLTPLQNELMMQLRSVNGSDRDRLYIAQQRAAHGQALSVQQAYALGGTVPTLKAAAGKIVPVVKQHIAMLMAM